MSRKRDLLVTTLAIAGLFLAAPAFAAGGGGGGGGGDGGGGGGGGGKSVYNREGDGDNRAAENMPGRGAPPTCPPGYVFVVKSGQCFRLKAGVLPDDVLYAQGRALALAGYYREALPILETVQRTDDAMVFTMRGYATRKLGDAAKAMALYDHALAIDPGNVNTHEYVGEAYVQMGRKELARVELAKVEKACGYTSCEQYEDLAKAIATGEVE